MKHRILSQGRLDSACFLYAIVNSYLALTKYDGLRDMDDLYKRWDSLLESMPFASDFLRAGSKEGTDKYNHHELLYDVAVETALGKLRSRGQRFESWRDEEVCIARDLRSKLDSNTVAIICPNDEHWVSAVGYDHGALVACSWELMDCRDSYTEHKTKDARIWNKRIKSNAKFDFTLLITRSA